MAVVLSVGALAVLAGCSARGSTDGVASPVAPGSAPVGAGGGDAGFGSTTSVPTGSVPAGRAGQGSVGTTGAGGTTDAVPVVKPDIITSGAVTVMVGRKSLQHDFDLASADAAAAGGFVASSSSELSGTSNPYADLTLRVPADRLATVLSEVDSLGKVTDKQLQGQDVTGQVVDLAARIANLGSEQVALRQLMGRAGSIPNILQVENQLFGVELQLEELTAQQNSLAERVAYSTLTLNLETAPAPAKPQPKPENAALHGLRLALHNTASALHGVAIAVGAAFPAIALLALILLTVLVWRRRRPSGSRPEAPAV